MLHPNRIITPKRHLMINRVTSKIIARKDKKNKNGIVPLALQVFVNKQRDVIPLYIYIDEKYWDAKERCVKNSHPEALYYNADIANAKTNVAAIRTMADQKKIKLTKDRFRAQLTQSISNADFVTFAFDEIEKRKGEIKESTRLQHKSSIRKLQKFRKKIPFSEIDKFLVIEYERWLYRKGNTINTVGTALKKLQTYLNLAIDAGYDFPNPFASFKIKKGESRKVFCRIAELHTLLNKYDSRSLSDSLQESLLLFLVESFSSLRISDIKRIDKSWITGKELSYEPVKGSKKQKRITFDLPDIALRLLKDLFVLKATKKLKSDQKVNDDLKLIAVTCGIQKPLTTHAARHTFATLYLSLKGTERGTVQALQIILGHSRIETTMIYVHLVEESVNEQIKNFDNEFK